MDDRNVLTVSRSHAGGAVDLGKQIFGNNTEVIRAAGSGNHFAILFTF